MPRGRIITSKRRTGTANPAAFRWLPGPFRVVAKVPAEVLVERKFRLAKTTDFKRVRRLGTSYAHPLVVLIALPNQLDYTRIGVTASRAVGGAVQRNRAKRVLRSAMQALLPGILPGQDIVLLARQPILSRKSHELEPVLQKLLGQAKLRNSA